MRRTRGITPSRRDFEQAAQVRESIKRPWERALYFTSPVRLAKARLRAARHETLRFRRRRRPLCFYAWERRPGTPDRDPRACLHCPLTPNNCPVHDPIPF